MPAAKWNRELVEAEARKYSRTIDFKRGSRGAYDWAERHGVVSEVTAFMSQFSDPDVLMQKITQELGTASRCAKIASDIWNADPSPFFVPNDDPELISEGTYLDFDAQMYDQAGIERSDRALDHIEQLQKYGTPEQVKEAWDMYLSYQTGGWKVDTGIMEIDMQGEEL